MLAMLAVLAVLVVVVPTTARPTVECGAHAHLVLASGKNLCECKPGLSPVQLPAGPGAHPTVCAHARAVGGAGQSHAGAALFGPPGSAHHCVCIPAPAAARHLDFGSAKRNRDLDFVGTSPGRTTGASSGSLQHPAAVATVGTVGTAPSPDASGDKRVTTKSTIVTAYFDMRSKHSSREYSAWMANMLSLQDAMVIYTTYDMIPKIMRHRAHARNRTHIVATKLEDTKMGTRYDSAFWNAQHILDPERGSHPDVRLYWVWNEKTELLKRAVELNPFQSNFFAWVDIGYFRGRRYNGQFMIKTIPPTLRTDQVLMLDVTSIVDSKWGKYLGGGFIGGYADGIRQWHTKYYATLDKNKHSFIGKDQPWMWKTCNTHPGLCALVVPKRGHGSQWFYMAPYMMGETSKDTNIVIEKNNLKDSADSALYDAAVLKHKRLTPHNMGPYLNSMVKWNDYRLGDIFKGRRDALDGVCSRFVHSIGCAYRRLSVQAMDFTAMVRILESRPNDECPPADVAVLHLRLGDGLCVEHDAQCRRTRRGVPDCWLHDDDCWIDRVSHDSALRYAYSRDWYASVVGGLSPNQTIILVSNDEHWSRTRDTRGADRRLGDAYLANVASYFQSRGFQVTKRTTRTPDEDFTFLCGARVFVPAGGGYSALAASIVATRGGVVLEPRRRANVSVVVPAIGSDLGANLQRLLRSVDGQTTVPTEVIVVASGVDGARCAREQRSGHPFSVRIECLPSLVNQATARNIGSDLARGEWVSFIDSDDEMLPERIAALVHAKHANPALRLFLHGWDKEEKKNKKNKGQMLRGEALYDVVKRTQGQHDWVLAAIMHSQVSVHRSVGVRFRESADMFRKEDSVFVRDVIQYLGRSNDQILFDPRPLGHHRPRVREGKPTKPPMGDYDYLQMMEQRCGVLCVFDAGEFDDGPHFQHRAIPRMECDAYFHLEVLRLEGHGQTRAPPHIPSEWRDAFTLNGSVPVSDWYIDENYVVADGAMSTATNLGNQLLHWSETYVNSMVDFARKGKLVGNYGLHETNALREGLRVVVDRLLGGRVLVIGSENPWVEACVLEAGAASVVTLEFATIKSEHPQIEAWTPLEWRARYVNGTIGLFDAVVSFSSLEHSGLGRYGDALNPWGDILEVARAWCVTRDGGALVVGVPYGKDEVQFNAHRVYGPKRWPYLSTNWLQEWRSKRSSFNKKAQRIHVFRKPSSFPHIHLPPINRRPHPPFSFTANSYSQARQDIVVRELSGNKKGGTFVELGGYDGITYSNTLRLEEEHGWSGLLIEANSVLCSKIIALQRNISTFCGCISDTHTPTISFRSDGVMNHALNKGKVVKADYYPKDWVGLGSGPPGWDRWLPPTKTRLDWCPSKGSGGAAFVQSLYASKAEHATACASIQRVGGNGDGGKLICTDNIRLNDCVVYSLGSRLDFSFEIDVVKRFGCQVHTFDCTVGTPPPSGRHSIPAGVLFHPWCVGGKDEIKPISSDLGHQGESGQYHTLATIRKTLGHASVDLLKMDIERHEFAVVATLTGDNAPRQMAFETHLHNAYGMWGRPVSKNEWDALWKTLGVLGFGVFAHEPNPLCLCCCEFSIVRRMPVEEWKNIAGDVAFIDPEHSDLMASSTAKEVQCLTPERLFDATRIKHIDYFSLDVEGAELWILELLFPLLRSGTLTVDVWTIEYRVIDKFQRNVVDKSRSKLDSIRHMFQQLGGYYEWGVLDISKQGKVSDSEGLDVVFVRDSGNPVT